MQFHKHPSPNNNIIVSQIIDRIKIRGRVGEN